MTIASAAASVAISSKLLSLVYLLRLPRNTFNLEGGSLP